MNISIKDLVWNYLGFGVTFSINVILLPFILHFLDSDELGLWFVFTSIGAFVTILDFGFSPQLARTITYAYNGAKKIESYGTDEMQGENKLPNLKLLLTLISSSKLLYAIIAIFLLFLLLSIGTLYVSQINQNLNNTTLYTSWIFYSIGCFINIYFSYFNAIFRGIGDFVSLNKAVVLSRCLQFIITIILLFFEFGIIAVSFAYLINTLAFRLFLMFLSYRSSNVLTNILNSSENIIFAEKLKLLKVIWFNAWREGLVTLSTFIVTQSNTILCSLFFGLAQTASYALGVQVITLISAISSIFYSTYQPLIVEANLQKNIKRREKYYSISLVIFFITFLTLIFLFLLFGLPLLSIIKSNTSIDFEIFLLCAIYLLVQNYISLNASYISTSNKLPYYSSFIITAIISIIFSILSAKYTDLGIKGLILSHLLAQLLYNAWKWPSYAMKDANTNPLKMILLVTSITKSKLKINIKKWA
jgi:O-antigen/teichoic acid export membrane protein